MTTHSLAHQTVGLSSSLKLKGLPLEGSKNRVAEAVDILQILRPRCRATDGSNSLQNRRGDFNVFFARPTCPLSSAGLDVIHHPALCSCIFSWKDHPTLSRKPMHHHISFSLFLLLPVPPPS